MYLRVSPFHSVFIREPIIEDLPEKFRWLTKPLANLPPFTSELFLLTPMSEVANAI
jgi:hypothetical protein